MGGGGGREQSILISIIAVGNIFLRSTLNKVIRRKNKLSVSKFKF